jgi:E3 ubiquitin-protein ligase DOA10
MLSSSIKIDFDVCDMKLFYFLSDIMKIYCLACFVRFSVEILYMSRFKHFMSIVKFSIYDLDTWK